MQRQVISSRTESSSIMGWDPSEPRKSELKPLDEQHQFNFRAYLQLRELEHQLADHVEAPYSADSEVAEETNGVDFIEEMGQYLSAGKQEVSCMKELMNDFIKDTRQALSTQLDKIRDEAVKLEPQVSLAVAFQNFKTPDYSPAIRRSLATQITKYIEGLRDTFLLSPTTPQITKDDVISAMRDGYKEKPRTQVVTWQVLRQAIGPRFFQRYKGTVSGTVASEIIYDDVSDFLPKEFWDARLASSNTEGESQKIASEELVETNTKLLFARAALERYSGSNSLVKVLVCLFGGHRDYLAKPKYEALHGKVREKSALAEVWFFDKEDLKKRESRKAKVGINYDERGGDDPNSDVGIVETSSDTDSEINFVGTVKRRRNYSRNYWYWHRTKVTEFDPAEAVELLKSAHSSQLGQRVLPQLKSFARLVQDLQEETSDEAAAAVFLCPAIVISARLGAFVATDDNVDHATVEDILSLLPGQCLTVAAFHKTVSSAISLAAIDAVAIVPTSLVKRCIFNPALSDLDKLADYFRPVISDTQPQRSKTVLILANKIVQKLLMLLLASIHASNVIPHEFNHGLDKTHWLSLGLMIFGNSYSLKRTEKEIRLKRFQLPNRMLGPV
jgi:hypothetical protein